MSHRTGSPSPCDRWSHSPTPLSRRQSAPGKCSCNAAAPLHSIRLGLRQLAHAASEDRGSQRRHCRESSWSLTPDRARDDALEQLEHSPIRVSNPTQSAKARPSGRVTNRRSHQVPSIAHPWPLPTGRKGSWRHPHLVRRAPDRAFPTQQIWL